MLITVALCLPVLVLFLAFVIEIANWFEHGRHLQTQADAAALAAAGDFTFPCSDAPIVNRAMSYGGQQYNAQIGGGQPRVHELINSPSYYGQPSKTDSNVNTGSPCADAAIDVKMTETDLPFLFGAGSLPFVDAHARVSIEQLQTLAGALPVGVPDVSPAVGKVTFVDESKSEGDPTRILGSAALHRRPGTTNGLAIWDNAADNGGTPIHLKVDRDHIGVRVAFGGASSTTCGDPLVECYDLGSTDGALYMQGWSRAGSGSASTPLVRGVTLFNGGTCTDSYFSSAATTCQIGVNAKVDFGTNADGTPVDPTTIKAAVTANVPSLKKDYGMKYDPTDGLWHTCDSSTKATSAPIPVAPSGGPIPVVLQWDTNVNGNNACGATNAKQHAGSFGEVQRMFSASADRTGPIKLLQVGADGASTFGANSLEECSAGNTSCTHDMVVTVGIQGSLKDAQSVNDQPVELRFAGGGSQSQGLDCDPALSTYKDEVAHGCGPSYTINTGTPCPNQTPWNAGLPSPWQCVATETGQYVNQIPPGLNLRILGNEKPSVCPPAGQPGHNNWSMWPHLPPGDPRIVQVFLTPFGSFSGSGGGTVPVLNFATFYVTGWTGQGSGFTNPCQGNGDDTASGPGVIEGHFITYIDTLNDQNNGDSTPCDFNSLGTCVAVLTE